MNLGRQFRASLNTVSIHNKQQYCIRVQLPIDEFVMLGFFTPVTGFSFSGTPSPVLNGWTPRPSRI